MRRFEVVGASIRIERVGPEAADLVFDLVLRLLCELGDEIDDLGTFDAEAMRRLWTENADRFHALVARSDPPDGAWGEAVGVITVNEAFAIYANGCVGVIDELYVCPEHRSSGVGALLVSAAKALARERGWTRLDVTAPEDERWSRTRRFYEREGFTFAGPKLKYRLGGERPAA